MFKNLFLAAVTAVLLLSPASTRADIEGAPFIPEVDARFNAIEQGNHIRNNKFPMGQTDGHWVQQLAQASYNFSTMTGAAGDHDTGVSLPKNAIIARTVIYSIKQPYGTSTPKVGFYCQNAYNLYNPVGTLTTSADGTFAEGTQTGTAASMSVLTAKCNIQATTAGTIQSGLVTAYIEYWVHQ